MAGEIASAIVRSAVRRPREEGGRAPQPRPCRLREPAEEGGR